jgi:hypothetical protein
MDSMVEARAPSLPPWDQVSMGWGGALRSTLARSSAAWLGKTRSAPQDSPRCGVVAGPAGVPVHHQQGGHVSPTVMRAECRSRSYESPWVLTPSLIFQGFEA